ncbi:P-II family nitrogen regulator [Microbacterium betulae]|uniref:P-II family nitrogen regulator n=1 Tax=Microbacterium betulae TaxID=2981139 RepID=A0AA97FJW1_9MICO|nr:P-II family nitrogen regulator [Microbacterium sp. AB]WOF24328.1 P-II family nitrogen regulator [Microbacterium sp. AB]
MKLITAVIQPGRLDDVRSALVDAGATGLTVARVKGHGAQQGRTEYYRGEAHAVEFRDKLRLELLTADEEAERIVDVIVAAARTGAIGDGKVWVTDVSHVVRVRTGERGPEAV